jgi:hypothetical protein
MEQDNKRLADIWLLISALNTAKYAITEINPDTMQPHTKMQFKNLRTNIDNFLVSSQSKMETKDRKRLADFNFENVAIMVETMSILAHVPINKQEEFLNKVNQIVFDVIETDANAVTELETKT